jgi:hypothetical protein
VPIKRIPRPCIELLRTPNPAAVRPGNEVVQSDRLPYANV